MSRKSWYARWKAKRAVQADEIAARKLQRQLDSQARAKLRVKLIGLAPMCPVRSCFKRMSPVIFKNKETGGWYLKAWWCRTHKQYILVENYPVSLTARIHERILKFPGQTESELVVDLEAPRADVNAEITRLKNQNKIAASGGRWYPTGPKR